MDLGGAIDGLPVNLTDLAILAVILISAIFALIRGFVHEILAVGCWIGAALATLVAFSLAQPLARQYIAIPLVADIVAGAAIFLLVLVLLSILTHWIARRVRKSSLGALDRSLGFLFGLLRGAVVVCAAWILFLYLVPHREDHPRWITEARSLPLVQQGSLMLLSVVPGSLLPRDFPMLEPEGEAAGQHKGAARQEGSGYKDSEREELRRLLESAQ